MWTYGRIPAVAACAALVIGAAPLAGQQPLPLEPVRPSGLPVSPVYEGWYRNGDGSYTLSFGYINRNSEEELDIPVGPGNNISPGEADRGQPTRFLPRRQYGVFTVNVPADFGNQEVVWTLDIRGQRFSIPARLHANYEIDALGAPATGVTPPALRLEAGGMEVRGPKGQTIGPLTVAVGAPLDLTVFATDQRNSQVTLRWSKYRGPGEVTFASETVQVDRQLSDGRSTATATFHAPGQYVLYVRANNAAVASAGHSQCCWTNGFIKVNVTPGNSR
jgi:hypothetical protein